VTFPSETGDPPPPSTMRTYVVGLLYEGPNRPSSPEEAAALQRGHLAVIGRLGREGRILVVGPFRDDGSLRGLTIFDTDSIEQAKAWFADDPAVQAGLFRMEFRPWYGAKGIGVHAARPVGE
jgi:uncharacterized protein